MKNKLSKLLVLSGLSKTQKGAFKSNGYYYRSGLRTTFKESLRYFAGGRVLDIGAGFGNEAKLLLKQGNEVVATDSNTEAVRHLRRLTKKYSKLDVLEESLPSLTAVGTFDLIVCEMVLHFLNRKDTLSSIKRMQAKTKAGGLNVISTYVDLAPLNQDESMKSYYKYLLPTGELKMLYDKWDIILYEEKSNLYSFKSARIIARKR